MAHTVKEKKHLSRVADLGCIICRKNGRPLVPAEIHHIREMTGMSKRASHFEVIPLCPYHHRLSQEAFHYNSKEFTQKWGTQRELLQETLKLLECCGGICENCYE